MELIKLDNIRMSWDGKNVLSDVNLTIKKGDFFAITGPNGGGKTTLLRLILKLLRPTKGTVEYLSDFRIGYLPQKNLVDSRFPITLNELVASGLLASKHITREEEKKKVKRILSLIDLEEHSDKTIGQLSGGQLQRGLLGRAIISEPEVLVFDEPLSYLDKRFEHKIYDIFADLSKRSTIILVSHEMSAISAMANRHLIVDHMIEECHASHHYAAETCDGENC